MPGAWSCCDVELLCFTVQLMISAMLWMEGGGVWVGGVCGFLLRSPTAESCVPALAFDGVTARYDGSASGHILLRSDYDIM